MISNTVITMILDENAPDAEQVATEEPDGLERDTGADRTHVVIDVRHDRQHELNDGLHEDARE